ncbi:MAG: hypothetical protein U0235_18275 [Polyangiaceae bacterium]
MAIRRAAPHRARACIPIFADRVYSVGGALDGQLNSTDEIAIGAFR